MRVYWSATIKTHFYLYVLHYYGDHGVQYIIGIVFLLIFFNEWLKGGEVLISPTSVTMFMSEQHILLSHAFYSWKIKCCSFLSSNRPRWETWLFRCDGQCLVWIRCHYLGISSQTYCILYHSWVTLAVWCSSSVTGPLILLCSFLAKMQPTL